MWQSKIVFCRDKNLPLKLEYKILSVIEKLLPQNVKGHKAFWE